MLELWFFRIEALAILWYEYDWLISLCKIKVDDHIRYRQKEETKRFINVHTQSISNVFTIVIVAKRWCTALLVYLTINHT